MTVRLFDWRDLPILHRYRRQFLFLDNVRLLTRGVSFLPAGALLSYFAPATGLFTYLCEGEECPEPLVGQVSHPGGSASARLSFLAPEEAVGAVDMTPLVELMACELGERGALRLIAEIDDQQPAFGALRKIGFAIYARQQIWRLDPLAGANPGEQASGAGSDGENSPPDACWQPYREQDALAVRALYTSLVPGLVQQVEPPPPNRMQGLVCYYGDAEHGGIYQGGKKDLRGELLGFVEFKSGPQGLWAQPFIHPDAESVATPLLLRLQTYLTRRSRPVYVCIRSYQSWLDAYLENAGAQPGARQAMLVKHLAALRRLKQPLALPALDNTRPDPTVPVARIEKHNGL